MDIIISNLQKADVFASLFQHMKLFTEHITIMFDKEKMYIQAMDASRVSILEFTIPVAWFDKYEHTCASAIPIGVHATCLYKILSTRDKAQEIHISFKEDESDKLYFHFTCGRSLTNGIAAAAAATDDDGAAVAVKDAVNKSVFDKRFELPLMDIDFETMHIPESECQAEFSILSGTFSSLIHQLKLFGDTLEIECSEEQILLHSLSVETGKMSVEIDINDLTEFSINEGETMNLSFSLSLLNNICMYNKLAKEVVIQLTSNFPMKVTYDLGDDASICFYLAPRINDD